MRGSSKGYAAHRAMALASSPVPAGSSAPPSISLAASRRRTIGTTALVTAMR